MNVFLVIFLAMVLIIFLLRKKVPIGPSILAAGLFIWATMAPDPNHLLVAAKKTLTMHRTYDLLLALYLIMCLEVELRSSGALDGMVRALQRIFSSVKFTLAIMPAFLGLLPSLGGARFSAPIVDEASKDLGLSGEYKSAINFWFRHVTEFCSPVIPGMIMACAIAGVSFKDLISHLCWLTPVAFALGWFFLMRPIKVPKEDKMPIDKAERNSNIIDTLLSLSPVLVNFCLIVFFDMGPSMAMLLVVLGLIPILKCSNRVLNLKEVFIGALDWKMLANVLSILYFIQILTETKVLNDIVTMLNTTALPVPVILATASFIVGLLTGMSQGHVAIIMPIVAALAPGNLNLVGVAMVFGIAGQMLTPTHVCLVVTLDYFKANIFKSLKPVFIIEVIILTIFSTYTYLTW